MSTLVNQMINNRAYGKQTLAPAVDLQYGAQMGFQPNFKELSANTPYARRPLIAQLLREPAGFQYLQDGQLMTATLKALIEEHPLRIEGLNATLTPDFGIETPTGGAGQVQSALTNMTRSVAAPSHVYQEKYGKGISNFWEFYMTELMMDPETKYPRIIGNAAGNLPKEILQDFMSFVTLYIEPDPTHRYVVEAYLCGNMMPRTGPPRESLRNLTAAMEGLEISIEFTAVTQSNWAVRQFAQTILDKINLTGVNPNNRAAFVDSISANVAAADTGYVPNLRRAALAA